MACLGFITGCGNYFAPGPTQRSVAATDLVGTWTYAPLCSGPAQVTLVLRPDGTFGQTVQEGTRTLTSQGGWRVVGSEVELDAALTEFNGWSIAQERWRVVDWDESPTGFGIFGGAGDPDCWVVFDWQP
ncbi:MAG: hypothetical protein AAGB29_07805 [Planctomycetota bacterium]